MAFRLSAESRLIRNVTHLCQRDAIALDEKLFECFSVDSLMELAGLACAQAIVKEFPDRKTKTYIFAGPGNNGGDGLVAARHLHHFGYKDLKVWYPKRRADSALFENLVKQLEQLEIPVLVKEEDVLFSTPRQNDDAHAVEDEPDVFIDAIFGFSFRGWRGAGKDAPFDRMVQYLAQTKKPVVSLDIPSGWEVDGREDEIRHELMGGEQMTSQSQETSTSATRNIVGTKINPHMLISLTAPKLAASSYTGIHYVGGRFVPESFGLTLPTFHDCDAIAKL
ncbi:unnamed protein product [Amoebophrya sp. A120]|nr:unnamed protein product [Amoebophrya sp. A120]|eukprot:GSA120T00003808001.1